MSIINLGEALSKWSMAVIAQLKHKMQSQRGASLSMALMLTLVVTTVAAVALTAATAVSGRYSQLEDMDRSYYNVTSAARMFWDEMGGGEIGKGVQVKVVRACDYTQDGDGSVAVDPNSWTVSIDDTFTIGEGTDSIELSKSNASIFQILTADLLFKSVPVGGETTARAYTCSVGRTQVANSINTSDWSTKDPSYAEFSYVPFDVKPTSDSDGNKIRPTKVTTSCVDTEEFCFAFTEDAATQKASPFRCTLDARVGVSDSAPRTTDIGANKYHVEWTTTVTWESVSMSRGGGSYA